MKLANAGKPHTGKYVAYYRVSTERQGASGLGLEAQQAAVKAYLNGDSAHQQDNFPTRSLHERADFNLIAGGEPERLLVANTHLDGNGASARVGSSSC